MIAARVAEAELRDARAIAGKGVEQQVDLQLGPAANDAFVAIAGLDRLRLEGLACAGRRAELALQLAQRFDVQLEALAFFFSEKRLDALELGAVDLQRA